MGTGSQPCCQQQRGRPLEWREVMENREPHCPDEELGNGGYQKSIRVPHTPCSHALPRTPESHLSLPGCSGPLPRLSSRSHSRLWGGSRCAHGQGRAAVLPLEEPLLPGCAAAHPRGLLVPPAPLPFLLPGPSSASSSSQRGCASARDVPREGTLIFSWHRATQSQAESGGEAEPRARTEAQGRRLRGYLCVPSSCPQQSVGQCHPHGSRARSGAGQRRGHTALCQPQAQGLHRGPTALGEKGSRSRPQVPHAAACAFTCAPCKGCPRVGAGPWCRM